MSETTGPSWRQLPWWRNPYLAVALAVLFVPAAEVLLKRGAMAAAAANHQLVGGMGFAVLLSHWTWLAIACYIGNFVFWLYALRYLALHLAFGLLSSTHALVPLACWWFLGEQIHPARWAGIGIVLLGVAVLARPATKAEEQL